MIPSSSTARCLLAALACCAAACTLDNPGADPVSGKLHFPIALAVDATGSRLFVANSDFDLRYNGGLITALDLSRIDVAMGGQTCTARAPCTIASIGPLLAGPGAEVKVGAFSSTLSLSTRGRRLFAVVRGDGAVVSIDIDRNGRTLSCFDGQSTGSTPACDATHQRGASPEQSERHAALPNEPQSLVVVPLLGDGEPGDDGLPVERQALVVTHASAGHASLFLDEARRDTLLPTLVYVMDGLADGMTSAALDPRSNLIAITNRTSSNVERIGIADDPSLGDRRLASARSYLFRSGNIALSGVHDGHDGRGILFDDDAARLYVVQRAPSALMVFDISGSQPRLHAAIEMCPGASLITGRTMRTPGADEQRKRIYVICYDAQAIFVVDPEIGELVNVIHTSGGPHQMVFDPVRPRAYLADFRDSVIRIVSLDPDAPDDFEHVVGILGVPTPVRGLD